MELNIKKTQESIELAKKLVEHMKDDEYKMKSFEVILNNLLENKSSSKKIKEDEISLHEKEIVPTKKIKGIKKLIEDVNVSEEQFYSLFDIEGTKANILDPPKGKNSSEEQFMNSTLLLILNYYLTGSYEMSSSILRKRLEEHGVGSLVNLSTNLNIKKRYILRKAGKKGNTNTFYKLTFPGIKGGLHLIKKLAGENEKEEKQK